MNVQRVERAAAAAAACCVPLVLSLLVEAAQTEGVFADANTAQRLVYFIGAALLLAVTAGIAVRALLRDGAPETALNGEKDVPAWRWPLAAALIALAVAALAFIYAGMYPLGEKNIMMVDMSGQYAPLLAKLRRLFLEGGSWLYARDVGLGTGFLPLFGYYLASPLNLLLVFFPVQFLPQGFLVVTLVKLALMAAAFTACAQVLYARRSPAFAACGVLYAGMMFVLAYSWCIMWLDSLVLLPVCVLALERLLNEHKPLLYVFSLCFALCVSFYLGFILCIFLCLWWLVWAVREARGWSALWHGAVRFAAASALGGGLSAALLLPVYKGLQTTSAAGGTMPALAAEFSLFDLPGQMLLGVQPTIRSGNLPNIGCGVLALLAIPLFLSLKSLPARRRAVFGGLLALLAASFCLNRLDLVWHGLHSPNDLPYRFSFVWSFTVLLMTCEVLLHIREVRPRAIGAVLGGLAVWLALADKLADGGLSVTSMYGTLALALVYGLVLWLGASGRMRAGAMCAVVLFCVTGESLAESSAQRYAMDAQEGYGRQSSWATPANLARQKAVDAMNAAAADNAFYRAELLPLQSFQDSAIYGYNGLSVYASTYYYTTTKTLKNLGYASNGVNSNIYRSFMPTVDSLMGIRYVMLQADLPNYQQLSQIGTVQEGDATWYVYENEKPLGIGYVGTEALRTWASTEYDPVRSQNSLYTALTGDTGSVLQLNPVTPAGGGTFAASQLTVNGTSFTLPDAAADGTAVFEASITNPGRVFIYVDCSAASDISVTGAQTWGVSPHEPYFIDDGNVGAGGTVSVTITGRNCSGNIYVATVDENVYENAMQQLTQNGLSLSEWRDGYAAGSVNAQQAGVLMTSIPYDAGWRVTVDGARVETYGVDGALLAFDVDAGAHTVVMRYTPPGFVPGVLVSAASLVCLLALWWLRRKGRLGAWWPQRADRTDGSGRRGEARGKERRQKDGAAAKQSGARAAHAQKVQAAVEAAPESEADRT